MASSDPPDLPRGLVGSGGTPVSKTARLPSVRPPRDLTLGGVQKKTFKPVIPAARAKEKSKAEDDGASGSSGTPSSRGGRHGSRQYEGLRGGRSQQGDDAGRGRGGGRGRGRGSAELIQSHSIFEQGPAEKLFKRSVWSDPTYSGGGSGGGGGQSSASSRGSIRIKQESASSKATQEILDKLLHDKTVELDEDLGSTNLPVKLPLYIGEVKLKQEGKVKLEDLSGEADNPDVRSCADLFNTEEMDAGELVLVQLPDCLPGMLPSASEERRLAAAQAHQSNQPQPPAAQPALDGKGDSKTTDSASLVDRLKLCRLSDLGDGCIGKLQVLRSGRTRLQLGSILLDVEMGAPAGFLQDVVAVEMSGSDQHNDMSVLGHIRHKLVISPDVGRLLFAPP